MLDAHTVIVLQDTTTAEWHPPRRNEPEIVGEGGPSGLSELVRSQHRANFDLWHEEDKARDPQATDAQIAEVKRTIDRLNQCRNDLVERIDEHLITGFASIFAAHPEAPLHSETPGLMIDRLSILALKIFHTREETERVTATGEHRARNRARLAVLNEQRADLAAALDALAAEFARGQRRFKLYRQMKMYNDPELNPVIYKHNS